MGLGGHLVDPSTIINHDWSRAIQIVAMVSSGFSIVGTMTTIYWFLTMRRNFRRNLILYLVVADFFKSLWYMIFSGLSLHRGAVQTSSSLCQGFGFLLQASTMACDYAILVMSIHMYLQIFSATSKFFGHDGLYRFRHTVTVLYFLIPSISGVLAFIRGREGYISQGPFCTLPIRPYWYRLALQWIPRYLVWLYIMFVAFRIYLHVGQGFRIFAREEDKSSNNDQTLDSVDLEERSRVLRITKKRAPRPNELQDLSSLTESTSGTPNANSPPGSNASDGPRLHSGGYPRQDSRIVIHPDGSDQSDLLRVPLDIKTHRNSVTTISSWRSSADMSTDFGRTPVNQLASIDEFGITSGNGSGLESADTPLKQRRRAIQRQLRLLFIYPVTYMMVWVIPFVYHSMYYSDHYAAHPIPLLSAFSVFCVTFAGFIDCLVFGWREKPWQHVPGADGTFVGSFKFWTFKKNKRRDWSTPAPAHIPSLGSRPDEPVDSPAQVAARSKKEQQHISVASSRQTSGQSTKPIVSLHKKTFSGTSERATRAAEQAAERLALERQDRESRVPVLRETTIAASGEWFERRLSECISPTREKSGFDDVLEDDDESDETY